MRRVFGSECPQCGAEVIAPEWSEHVSAHCVRNTWSCDICDCQFEEAVCLSAPELAGSTKFQLGFRRRPSLFGASRERLRRAVARS